MRDAKGIADRVAAILEERGVNAIAVNSVNAPGAKTTHAGRVIDLSGLSDGHSVEEAIQVQKELFETARDVAQSTDPARFFIAVADLFGSSPHSQWTGSIQA